jgi:hypothetical protein
LQIVISAIGLVQTVVLVGTQTDGTSSPYFGILIGETGVLLLLIIAQWYRHNTNAKVAIANRTHDESADSPKPVVVELEPLEKATESIQQQSGTSSGSASLQASGESSADGNRGKSPLKVHLPRSLSGSGHPKATTEAPGEIAADSLVDPATAPRDSL